MHWAPTRPLATPLDWLETATRLRIRGRASWATDLDATDRIRCRRTFPSGLLPAADRRNAVPNERTPMKRNGRERSTDGQPSDTPINRPARALERYISTPNGGTAPRCQGHKKNGDQCGAPARKGMSVCARHGGGLAAREATGERKRVAGGRPPTHGLYSRVGRRRLTGA